MGKVKNKVKENKNLKKKKTTKRKHFKSWKQIYCKKH